MRAAGFLRRLVRSGPHDPQELHDETQFSFSHPKGEHLGLGCVAMEVTEKSHFQIHLKQVEAIGKIAYWRSSISENSILQTSSNLASVLSCSHNEARSLMEARFESIPEKSCRDQVKRQVQDAIKNRGTYTIEYPFQSGSNALKHLRETATPVLNPSGDVVEMVGILQDWTEEAQNREALRQRQEELETIVAERTQELSLALEKSNNSGQVLRYMLDYDLLTGVESRSRFYQRCADGQRSGDLCIAIIEIDNFQSVNDLYGHEAGDLALREICRVIQNSMPEGALLARLQGKEFVLTAETKDFSGFVSDCDRIREAVLSAPLGQEGYTFHRSISGGCAFLNKDGPLSRALKAANLSLQEAKASGRDKILGADRRVLARAGLGDEELITVLHVKGGLDADEIGFAVQPIVHGESRHILGLEALIRWRRGDKLLSPARFVDQYNALIERPAERHWRFVIWRKLLDKLASVPGPYVSFNIRLEEMNENFLAEATQMIADYSAKDRRLVFEISEDRVQGYADFKKIDMVIAGLKEAGGLIALDDFGKESSNLTRLTSFPVDIVKLDRALIIDIGENSKSLLAVKAVHSIVEDAGMALIAEGIETEIQRSALNQAGVYKHQGYFYAKPMFPEDLIEEIQSGTMKLASA